MVQSSFIQNNRVTRQRREIGTAFQLWDSLPLGTVSTLPRGKPIVNTFPFKMNKYLLKSGKRRIAPHKRPVSMQIAQGNRRIDCIRNCIFTGKYSIFMQYFVYFQAVN
ncbi:MAG: hypothetical protein RR350_08260 [Oscillibacter sp.]